MQIGTANNINYRKKAVYEENHLCMITTSKFFEPPRVVAAGPPNNSNFAND